MLLKLRNRSRRATAVFWFDCLLEVGLGAVWEFHLEVAWLVVLGSGSWVLLDVAGVLGRLEAGLSSHEEKDDLDKHDDEVSEEADDHPEFDGFYFVVGIRSVAEHQKHNKVNNEAHDFFNNNQNTTNVHEGLEAHNSEHNHEQIDDPVDKPDSSWFAEHHEGACDHEDVSENPDEVVPLADRVGGEDGLLLMHVTEVVADTFSGAVFSKSDGFYFKLDFKV